MSEREFRVCAVYDTETSDDGQGGAYTHLYQINDLRGVSLRDYRPGCRGETVNLYRSDEEVHLALSNLVQWGMDANVVPVVCAYNLMFDLTPLMAWLADNFSLSVLAQSSTKVYTLDLALMDAPDVPVLRFWDTFFLEMGGLAAMGETCGVAKACGDWDYDLVRTPKTPLTEEEVGYATLDVQVIPAYLRYLLEANPWADPTQFGVTLMTKTSFVRQMAKIEIGPLMEEGEDGSKKTLYQTMMLLCHMERPRTFRQFAMRRACYRGGFTFTAANNAFKVFKNCAKYDVTSMHHTYINGRFIPTRFRPCDVEYITRAAEAVAATSVSDVLQRFQKPFYRAFHALFRFTGLKLKEGSCFEAWGIGCLPQGKFSSKAQDDYQSALNQDVEQIVKDNGFKDVASKGARFAFSKLMQADVACVWLNEQELWNVSRVYQWDSMEVLQGEASSTFVRPPDYVMLQSHLLFQRKQEMKHITERYGHVEGYTVESSTLPEAIIRSVNDGTADPDFLKAYYNSTVKGQFNSIYGCQAQCEYKPDYIVDGDGQIVVDAETRPSEDSWEEVQPSSNKVLYTYGMRMVGGSRMHMVMAMELVWDAFGSAVSVTGGDTDSMVVALGDSGVSAEDVSRALEPLKVASSRGIALCATRIRANFPDLASELEGVGGFCVEEEYIPEHVDLWNKCRVSLKEGGHVAVTMAGVRRPRGAYTIETLIEDEMAKGMTFEEAVSLCIGPGVEISPEVSHALDHKYPDSYRERFQGYVTDYRGETAWVDAPRAVALTDASRDVCDITKLTNCLNVRYLQSIGRRLDMRPRVLHEGYIDVWDTDGEWVKI